MFVYKKKFKKIVYFLSAVVFVLPFAVSAQIKAPSNDNAAGSNSVILDIAQNIIGWLLAAAGIIGVIGLAIAGILWMTAGGELDRIGQAKDILVRSFIGIAVSIIGLVILNFIRMYV